MAKADPNKLYKNPNDGKWYKPDPLAAGGFRPATNKEIASADIGSLNIVDGQAFPYYKRWNIESFANDANQLQEWLMSNPNLVVKKTGGGRPFDIAVSQDGGATFKLLDPAPKRYFKSTSLMTKAGEKVLNAGMELATDPAEFARDILDTSVDVIQGTLTGLATVGGAVLGPLTGAGAGYGTEVARQGIGKAQGMNKEIKQIPALVSGAASAVYPLATQTVPWMFKGLKPVAMEGAAKFASARADTAIEDTAILARRIKDPAKAGESVADVEKAAHAIRAEIARIKDTDFPEKAITNQMVQDAKRTTVDMTKQLQPLSNLTKPDNVPQSLEAAGAEFVDHDLPDKATDLINMTYGLLKSAGVKDPTQTPNHIAEFVKDRVWEAAKDMKLFKGREITVPFKKELKALGGRIADAISENVDSELGVNQQTGKKYSQLMADMSDKMRQLEYWQQAAGVWEWKRDAAGNVLDDKLYLDHIAGGRKMVSTIENFWDQSHHGIVMAIQNLKKSFGVDIADRIERAALSTKIGKPGTGGKMGLFPALAAGGGVKLGGAIGSVAGVGGFGTYLATGSPGLGLLAGAAAGLAPAVASSPRFIVGAAKTLGPAVSKLSANLTEAGTDPYLRSLVDTAIQASAKKAQGY